MSRGRFQSLVYPISGRIDFAIDNIESFRGSVHSDTLKFGKCEWRLEVKIEFSDETVDKKCLIIYLRCCSAIEEGKGIEVGTKFSLINQLNRGKDDTIDREILFTSENRLWGYATCQEWSELLYDGYVMDNRILVECSLRIDSEDEIKRGLIDFLEKRPNDQDMKVMLKKTNSSRIELFEEEIEVSVISKELLFIEGPRMFGLKTKLAIQKSSQQWVAVYLDLESENGSKWWMCDTSVEFRFVNCIDKDRSVCRPFECLYSGVSFNWGFVRAMTWDELVILSNGFVKNGKIKLQVFLHFRSLYGFDEMTEPIDRPMKKMMETVLVIGEKRFYVLEKVLAEKSLHFRQLYLSKPKKKEEKEAKFEVTSVEIENFIRLLELVHNVDTDICEDNATGVLEAIVRFKAPECFEMCDKILKAQELNDILQVLEWVDKYPLPGLRRKFLLKLKDETLFKLVTHPSTYRSLSSDMKVAIDECKLIPEENETEEVERNDYKFCTNFKRKNDSTDVEIEVDGYRYYANKQILANASHFFLKQFYGPLSDGSSRIVVVNVSSQRFEKLLTHIYHPSRPVTSANLVSLLQLARQFSVPRLMDKCEEYLVLKDSIQLIDKLEYAGLYDLRFLLESCLKWAKDKEKMNEVKSHRKFRRLQPRVVTELMNREAEESKRN